jgi:MOSC domain-containing protein YiiM/uncharacterized protein YndB with AHSA1/START domain
VEDSGSESYRSIMSATRVHQHIEVPRASIFRLLLDPAAISKWRVPDGMTAHIHVFEAREGGAIRVSLTYDVPTGTGKTTAHTDTYHGRFVEIVPNEKVVETNEFETSDPAMQGEMISTITLTDAADGGTDVVGVHENLPPGLNASDNETGWRMALSKLAALAENPSIDSGRVERLWVKRAHRGAMDPRETIELVAGRGVAGSANQGGRRQVTLLERETWERLMQELGSDVGPETRRANVLVSGIDLRASRGRILRIGRTLVRVAGEVKPCERMEEAVPGLRALMYPDWRGGAFAVVLEGGAVRVGDPVRWEDPAQP